MSAPRARAGRACLRQIDDEHRQVVTERSQADARVLVDVALADLEKAPVRRERGEPVADRLAGERIQHDVDSAPAGRSSTSSANASARESMTCSTPSARRNSRFSGTSGGGEDFRADEPRDLHRREADAARGGVDEQPSRRLAHRAEVVEGVLAVRKTTGMRAASSAAGRAGAHHATRDHGEVRAEAPGAIASTSSPLAPSADTAPRRRPARALVAEEEVVVAENRVDAERLHDVAEIEGRGCTSISTSPRSGRRRRRAAHARPSSEPGDATSTR